jgi:hypothetical protein
MKEEPVTVYFNALQSHSLKLTDKTTRILSLGCRCCGRKSNQMPPECEVSILPLHIPCFYSKCCWIWAVVFLHVWHDCPICLNHRRQRYMIKFSYPQFIKLLKCASVLDRGSFPADLMDSEGSKRRMMRIVGLNRLYHVMMFRNGSIRVFGTI